MKRLLISAVFLASLTGCASYEYVGGTGGYYTGYPTYSYPGGYYGGWSSYGLYGGGLNYWGGYHHPPYRMAHPRRHSGWGGMDDTIRHAMEAARGRGIIRLGGGIIRQPMGAPGIMAAKGRRAGLRLRGIMGADGIIAKHGCGCQAV